MALLGLVHRTVLGKGPSQFCEYFKLDENRTNGKHTRQLMQYDYDVTDFLYPNSSPAEYVQRSILGVARIYNRLPARIVEGTRSVSEFQRELQSLLKDAAGRHDLQWKR
eukprot:8716557-Karenia_brevis.AAC.1